MSDSSADHYAKLEPKVAKSTQPTHHEKKVVGDLARCTSNCHRDSLVPVSSKIRVLLQ